MALRNPFRRRTIGFSSLVVWLQISPKQFRRAARAVGHASVELPPMRDEAHEPPTDLDLRLFCEPAVYATCIELEKTPRELTQPDDVHRIASWQRRLGAHYADIEHFVTSHSMAAVVGVQGYEPRSAVARLACIRHNIPYLAIENTAVRDRMIWDNISGITTIKNLARSFYWRYEPTTAQDDAEAYCEWLIARTRELKQQEHAGPSQAEPLPDHAPFALFLGQVYTDSATVTGLKHWETPLEPMRHAINEARRLGLRLVIKLHPKEMSGDDPLRLRPYNQLTWRKMQADPELSAMLQQHQVVVDDANRLDTFALIDKAAVVVTVNSQTGLEAAIRGKPVVVCGDSFYGDLGFTFEAPSPQLFAAKFEEACANPRAARSCRQARKFAFIFFEKYCTPKNAHWRRGLGDPWLPSCGGSSACAQTRLLTGSSI